MSEVPRPWTVLSLLDWTTGHLASRGFDEARLHVELLLAHVLQLKRLDLYLQFDRPLSQEELASFRTLYERRLKHEPLQYLVGETEFMGMKFTVSPGVLIPRPETEVLVEEAIRILKEKQLPAPRVLDVGCGSGNIGIPIAKEFPSSKILGIDSDEAAVTLARQNARSHALGNMEFERRDILRETLDDRRFAMVLSNPPYIPANEMAALQEEVRIFEPRGALTDEHDGMTLYRRLAEVGTSLLEPDGVIGLEVGCNQSDAVSELFRQSGFSRVRSVVDFAGIERVIIAQLGDL